MIRAIIFSAWAWMKFQTDPGARVYSYNRLPISSPLASHCTYTVLLTNSLDWVRYGNVTYFSLQVYQSWNFLHDLPIRDTTGNASRQLTWCNSMSPNKLSTVAHYRAIYECWWAVSLPLSALNPDPLSQASTDVASAKQLYDWCQLSGHPLGTHTSQPLVYTNILAPNRQELALGWHCNWAGWCLLSGWYPPSVDGPGVPVTSTLMAFCWHSPRESGKVRTSSSPSGKG